PPSATVQLISQSGDPVGQGQTRTLTSADGAITASLNPLIGGIIVRVGSSWAFNFGPGSGSTFGVGTYSGAGVSGSGGQPILNVTSPVHNCSQVRGQFTVLEFSMDSSLNITALAIDFEQH